VVADPPALAQADPLAPRMVLVRAESIAPPVPPEPETIGLASSSPNVQVGLRDDTSAPRANALTIALGAAAYEALLIVAAILCLLVSGLAVTDRVLVFRARRRAAWRMPPFLDLATGRLVS
jgi:hypothetical protein